MKKFKEFIAEAKRGDIRTAIMKARGAKEYTDKQAAVVTHPMGIHVISHSKGNWKVHATGKSVTMAKKGDVLSTSQVYALDHHGHDITVLEPR